MKALMIVRLALFVTVSEITAVEEKFSVVGCYRDSKDARLLPELIVNYRTNGGALDWINLNDSVVKPCAKAAIDKGYEYFGVEFYGECWSGPKGSEASITIDKISTDCVSGVGKALTIMVYKKITTECLQYRSLSEPDRVISYPRGRKCDYTLESGQNIWYRFTGEAGNAMAHKCTYTKRCGTYLTGWLHGNPPLVQEGIVERKVCFSSKTTSNTGNCCAEHGYIKVRNCGQFYVYNKLSDVVPGCPMRYCGNLGV